MTIAFWWWWVVMLIILPFSFKYRNALLLAVACLITGSVVKVVPISSLIQLLIFGCFVFFMLLMQSATIKKSYINPADYVGLIITVNDGMLKRNMAQIDKRKVRLRNIQEFRTGDKVRIVGIEDNALLLERITKQA